MLLKDAIKGLDCVIIGNDDINVQGIRYSKDASLKDIAIIFSPEEVNDSPSNVVILPMGIYDTNKTMILALDVTMISIQIAKRFINDGIYNDYKKPFKNYKIIDNVRYGLNTVIGKNTYIDCFSSIGDNVKIGDNCFIGSNVTIGSNVVICNNVYIADGARIGSKASCDYREGSVTEHFSGIGNLLVHDNVEIGCNSIIERGAFSDTVIGANTIIGDSVCVGHDTIIGSNVKIMGQVGIAGNVVIKENVVICAQCGINGNITIGKNSVIKAKSGVWKSVREREVISGQFGRSHIDELKLKGYLNSLLKRR